MIRPNEQTAVCPPVPVTRVEIRFDTLKDVRAALFLELADLPDRQRAVLASRLAAKLRDGGWLADAIEQHYNATATAEKIGRTPEHVVKECKAGRFGVVYRDDGGWLIPASGIQSWLERRIFGGSMNGGPR